MIRGCRAATYRSVTPTLHARAGVRGGQGLRQFGAVPAYEFALQHPGRTAGVACLGIPFSPVPFSFEATMPEGFYILRWGVRDVPPPPP